MTERIGTILSSWGKADNEYSCVRRLLHLVALNKFYRVFTFTTDVTGFYLDAERNEPICLHHGKDLPIFKDEDSDEYAEDFARDLNLLTQESSARFAATLKAIEQQGKKIYTDDAKYKDRYIYLN